MPWYRRPEEAEPPEPVGGGRGRGGSARGRGRGRPAREPPHPYLGPHGPYAPHPYYHNPPRMEDILPHWQYVLRAQQESHQPPNPSMLGSQRFPAWRDAHAGSTPYGNYEGSPFAAPGFHHPAFSQATYTRYANQIPTQQKGPQQRVDKRTSKKGDSSKEKRSSSVRTEATQKLSNSNISKLRSSQASNVEENGNSTHHVTDLLTTFVAQPVAPKTLDETAEFLNHPQLVLQQNKIMSSSSNVARPLHASSDALSQITTITRDPPEAAAALHPMLLLSHKEVQALGARDTVIAKHDERGASAQLPDFRKYSELSVTIAEVEPPPAHQASVAKTNTCVKYPDLHTPPLAHQAPALPTPAQQQSARLHTLPSPPPAHQSSTLQQTSTNPFCSQTRQLSIVKATTETHATYDRHQILSKAQLIYEPSTETLAAENVLYRPEKDLLTKERVVYQRNNIMFAKTEIVYKDVIASREAVYESDKVTARETVIQRPTNAMETATQQNVTSALKSMQHSQPDVLRSTAALYRKQADIIAGAQTRTHGFVEAEHRSRSDTFAQMVAAEQTYAKALVEAEEQSRSDAIAQMISEQKTRTQSRVETEHRSRTDALAQMIAAEQTYNQALVEAEYRSRSNAYAQMVAAEQMYAKALVEAQQRCQSEAFLQMIAEQKIRTQALLEAEHRSRSDAFAQMVATEQSYTKALVKAQQRSRNNAIAPMIAEQKTRTQALVEGEHRSRTNVLAQMIAAEQTYNQALVEAECRSRAAIYAQGHHQNYSLKESEVYTNSLGTTPNFRGIPSNENEQNKSSEAIESLQLLQRLLQNNAITIESNSETPSQTLRQTRKRKKPSTQPSPAAPPPQLQPSTSSGSSRAPAPAPDLQALIALNWSLQNRQGTPRYTEHPTAVPNGQTTAASDSDDD